MTEILEKIYYDIGNPGGYGTIDKLYEAARKEDASISKSDVERFWRSQFTSTLHADARRVYPRNRMIAERPGQHFQADLADLQMHASANDGFKYLLVVIDIFSKMAYVRPLKSKHCANMKLAFDSIFKDVEPPETIFSDNGTEFHCLKDYFKTLHVNQHFTSNQDVKAAVAERFCRTIKSRMYKYFTARGTRKYTVVLEQLVDSYNKTKHRSIKMRPIDVGDHNKSTVFWNLYGKANMKEVTGSLVKRPKLQEGDKVRVKYELGVFDKRYLANWKDEIFTIAKVLRGPLPLYRLRNSSGQLLRQRLYEQELQLVYENEYRIENIVKRDKKNKKVLVKWLGYGPEHNSWVPESEVRDL